MKQLRQVRRGTNDAAAVMYSQQWSADALDDRQAPGSVRTASALAARATEEDRARARVGPTVVRIHSTVLRRITLRSRAREETVMPIHSRGAHRGLMTHAGKALARIVVGGRRAG